MVMGWLKESNHWKHIIGCFVIAVIGIALGLGFGMSIVQAAILGWYSAVAGGVVAEYKDYKYGSKFDCQDIIADLIGAFIGVAIAVKIYLIWTTM